MPLPDPPLPPEELRSRDRHRLALADTVKQLRAAVGLSQEALAELANVSRPTIARIEAGTHSVSVDRLWSLAAALNVSAAELIRTTERIARRMN